MPRHVISLAAVLSLLVAAGCGYLDEDILLSEQDFQDSLSMSVSGQTIGGMGVGTSVGCGVARGYASHANYGRRMIGHPMVIHATLGVHGAEAGGPAASNARRSGPTNGSDYARLEDDQPQQAPLHTGLETWGQYLEAEMQRAR